MGRPEDFSDAEIDAGGTLTLLENKMDRQVACALAKGGKTRHLFALVERGGWFAARRFRTWMSAKLDAGKRADGTPRNYSKMSLAQLHAATGIDLSMVASDTTEGKLLVLNHRTVPECPVVSAPRTSAGFGFGPGAPPPAASRRADAIALDLLD